MTKTLYLACAVALLAAASVSAIAAGPASTGGTATASEAGSAPGQAAAPRNILGGSDQPSGAVATGSAADGVNDAVRGTNTPGRGIDGTTGGPSSGPAGNGSSADGSDGPPERTGE